MPVIWRSYNNRIYVFACTQLAKIRITVTSLVVTILLVLGIALFDHALGTIQIVFIRVTDRKSPSAVLIYQATKNSSALPTATYQA